MSSIDRPEISELVGIYLLRDLSEMVMKNNQDDGLGAKMAEK